MATLDDQWLTSKIESTQARAFASSELLACPSCLRANPPTRANCVYCGAMLGGNVKALSTTGTGTVPEIKPEDVVNVVAVGARLDGCELSDEIAESLNLTTSELNVLFSGEVTPLYASATEQAQAISDKLRSAGIESVTISDAQLNLATPAKQIAGLAMDNDGLTASVRRTGERVPVRWNDVVLIVLGRLYFTTTEVEQKRDKSKRVLDERQLTSDEAVVDIYSHADETGWRIRAGSFDFSCLGREKKATAFENFRTLADLLRRNSPQAVCDDGYLRLRASLNKVWPLEARAGATEKRRTLTAETNATATVSDNELQFTRYSRLLRFFHNSELQDDAQQS